MAGLPALSDILEEYQLVEAEYRYRLLIDLDGVEYLDSTGLGVLVGAMRRVVQQGGELKLRCSNLRTRRIFEVTGLVNVFDISGGEERTRS